MKTRNDLEQTKHLKSQIQEITGYSKAQLLKEANDAIKKSEEEAANNTEEMDIDPDMGFELLMLRLKSEGKTPVDEETYNERLRWENQIVVRKKKFKKVLIVAAAVCVMLLGASINVVAKNGHKVATYPGVKNRNLQLIFNTSTKVENDSLDNAYNEIAQQLEIPVLMLIYMPDEMQFYDFVNDGTRTRIRFYYKGKYLFLKENKISSFNFISITESDRNIHQKVYNKWLGENLYIEENLLDNGEIEYSVNIENDEAFYCFAGVIEKDIFIKIVESLIYQ